MSYIIPKRVLDEMNYNPELFKQLNESYAQQPHVHTPELRERRHYDPTVIPADVWVCAECEEPVDPPIYHQEER